MMAITIQESLRGLLYTPFYAAIERGAYAAEGVEVRFIAAAAAPPAPEGLYDGSIDVLWGGPMRVMQTYAKRPDCDLVCFGEAVTRDPFMLVGREPRPGFALTDLARLRFASVSEVPTPWLCLQDDIRRAGLDPDTLPRVADRAMGDNITALRAGGLDAVQLFEPYAETLIAAGEGHLWYAAANRGATSYTTFYARKRLLVERRQELAGLVRGLYRTQRWLHAAALDELAAIVRPYFPEVAPAVLTGALARYRSLGVWGRDPVLPRGGYDRLKAALISGRFVAGTPYETAVDNSLATAALRDVGAPA
jgi:NitT/TauT family transport system substrate-binding protein